MDPNQIRFQAGKKLPFVATRSFALGTTGMQVPKGAEVLFDGSTVEFAGMEYSYPQLRGAVRAQWIVLAENFDENFAYDRPVSANIQVRHPTNGGNPMQPQQKTTIVTTESDERVVGNAVQHASSTKTANNGYQRGNPVNPGNMAAGQPSLQIEEQDGTPVRTLKTAAGEKAKSQRTVLTSESVGSALREANAAGRIEPGQGITEEEMLERMAPEDREVYLAEKAAHKSKYVDEGPSARAVAAPATSRKVASVPRAQATTTDGIKTTPSVGGGIEVADMAGMGGQVRESVVVQDGIVFKTTNGPDKSLKDQTHPRAADASAQKSASVNGTADVRRMVAKQFCADFPDSYDFGQPAKKKLARLQADFEDRPDVIKAVFAAESDDFKAILVKEFPEAFAG